MKDTRKKTQWILKKSGWFVMNIGLCFWMKEMIFWRIENNHVFSTLLELRERSQESCSKNTLPQLLFIGDIIKFQNQKNNVEYIDDEVKERRSLMNCRESIAD